MIIRPSKLRISRTSVALVKWMVYVVDLDTSITRILDRYGEWSMGDGVEYGNDFSDGVVSMRNRYLLVIFVDHDIGRIHVVEDGDSGCEQDSDGKRY